VLWTCKKRMMTIYKIVALSAAEVIMNGNRKAKKAR
jgi:hypothetical protein